MNPAIRDGWANPEKKIDNRRFEISEKPRGLRTYSYGSAGQDGKWVTADDGLRITGGDCRNNGDNSVINNYDIYKDIVGNPRKVGSKIDIGAYELQ